MDFVFFAWWHRCNLPHGTARTTRLTLIDLNYCMLQYTGM